MNEQVLRSPKTMVRKEIRSPWWKRLHPVVKLKELKSFMKTFKSFQKH